MSDNPGFIHAKLHEPHAPVPLDPIAATLVSVGVNMGDHGETVWRSVEIDPDETVRELLERLIPAGSRYTVRQYDNYVRLSFAQPRPEKGPDNDVF